MKRVNRNVTKNTTDSRVYKLATRQKTLRCNYCPPNRGCNTNWFTGNDKNWKKDRKTQWRE